MEKDQTSPYDTSHYYGSIVAFGMDTEALVTSARGSRQEVTTERKYGQDKCCSQQFDRGNPEL